MILDCIVTSCNMNPLYYDFIPMFINFWKKLYPNIDIKIILLNYILPTELEKYKDYIIIFKPIQNISTAFISQYIRLLYPCILNYKNGIMITDIDIFPMNNIYYSDPIKYIEDNKFIYYRKGCTSQNEIAMCYNVAINNTWRDIFKIYSFEDIVNRLIHVYSNITYLDGAGNIGWSTDQLDLFNSIQEWNKKTNNFIELTDLETKFNRLDRSQNFNVEIIKDKIENGVYSDYHALRPYKQYKEINDIIYHNI